MSQEHSTAEQYFEGLFNDELTRIKALAISIIGMDRAAGQLEHHVVLYQMGELAEMILEQESRIRKILGDLEMEMRKEKIQIPQAA